MIKSIFSLTSLFLLLLSPTKADFEGKLITSNQGCSISGISSVNGFSANIYSYSYSDLSDYSNTAYFNGGYNSDLITTVSLVADPNFNSNNGYSTTATDLLWGAEVPITNFAAELTGYFYGMYIFHIINKYI